MKITPEQDKFLCSIIEASNGVNTVKILWNLQKLIVEREKQIRQNCMTEINALEDCVYKGNTLSGNKSSFEIHKAIIKN